MSRGHKLPEVAKGFGVATKASEDAKNLLFPVDTTELNAPDKREKPDRKYDWSKANINDAGNFAFGKSDKNPDQDGAHKAMKMGIHGEEWPNSKVIAKKDMVIKTQK